MLVGIDRKKTREHVCVCVLGGGKQKLVTQKTIFKARQTRASPRFKMLTLRVYRNILPFSSVVPWLVLSSSFSFFPFIFLLLFLPPTLCLSELCDYTHVHARSLLLLLSKRCSAFTLDNLHMSPPTVLDSLD